MAKWLKSILCIVLAVAALTVTEFVIGIFQVSNYAMGQPAFESLEIIDANGVARSVDPDFSMLPWDWQEGESLRATCRMPTVQELPDLYDDGFIFFIPESAEFIFLIDGQEVYRSVYSAPAADYSFSEIQLSVLPEWSGAELTVIMTPMGPDASSATLYNLSFMSFSSYKHDYASTYSLGNRNAIPAGSYSMIFLLVFSFFILSIIIGKPDWSLLVLSLIAGVTFFWYMGTYFGYFFLPDSVLAFIDNRLIIPIVLALTLVYLFLNRSGEFWKRLAIVFATTLLCFSLTYVCLLLAGSSKALLMRGILLDTFHGYLVPIWLVPYMTVMCGSVSFYNIIRLQFSARSEARALSIRQNLLSDNYRAIEQRFTETATLRHDWKNQITALNLLYQTGDLEKLGQRLQDLDSAVDNLRLPTYSECFIVNSILQNASVRAARDGIDFRANTPLPERIGMDEGDICSFFINMLDNALEAAVKVPEGENRFIDLTIKINQGFLAVCCRNSCADRVDLENGLPATTKTGEEGHGLGLRQMEQIAKRYGSKLDLACGDGVFTVQTAFKLKKANKKAPAEAGASS